MADDPVNLFSQQEANRRKSRWLIVGFIAFFAWLGFGGDWIAYQVTLTAPPNQYHHVFPWFGLLLSAIAAAIAWYAWKTGPDKVIWATGAWELLEPVGDKQKQLVNVVEEMSVASGLPRPRIFIIDDADPNALATGRDAQTARIAVTTGLLDTLNRDELQAVIAHEMGHVKNLDVQLMTFLAALIGAVALISHGLGRLLWQGGGGLRGGGSGRSRGKSNLGPAVIVVIVLYVISWMLAPLVCRLMAMGVSRKREFLADAMSAQFTRNPMALASALDKIESASAPTTSIQRGCAHLCIADPLGHSLSVKEGFFADLFGTHPPMALRVAKLKAMGYQAQKKSGTFQAQ
jgi:heat shock protein HtpX